MTETPSKIIDRAMLRALVDAGYAPLSDLVEYDAKRDFANSLDEGYAAIRNRMASGGPGWEPKR